MARAPKAEASGATQRRVVGLVRRIHGLRGEVRVEVLTDDPAARFARGRQLFREGSPDPLTVAWSAPIADGPGWRLRFRELPDRTAAESLRDAYLEAEVADRPSAASAPSAAASPARPEAVWWDEVVGTPVVGPDGESLGTVREVYRVAETEVYSVEGGSRGSFELPVVRDWIRAFEPRSGRIVVDPAGLDLPPRGRARRPRGRRTANAARGAAPGVSPPEDA